MAKNFTELSNEEVAFYALSWLFANRPELDVEEAMKHKCPTCLGFIPNNERIGEYSGALSRRDNKTEICSDCGAREAIEDWISNT